VRAHQRKRRIGTALVGAMLMTVALVGGGAMASADPVGGDSEAVPATRRIDVGAVRSMKLTDALIRRYGSREKVPDRLWAAAHKGPDLAARPPANQVSGVAAAVSNACHENGTWVGLCLWDGWDASTGPTGYLRRFPYAGSCGHSFALRDIVGPPAGVDWDNRVDYFQNHSAGDFVFFADVDFGPLGGGVGPWSVGKVPSWLVNDISEIWYFCAPPV